MNRIWGSVVSVGSLMVLAGVVTPACNHTDSSIFIENVAAPPTAQTSLTTQCGYPAPDPTETYLTAGVLDIALSQTYSARVLVGNQLNTQADPESDRAETSRVELTTASVSVTDSSGATQFGGSYSTAIDDFIDPGGGGTPGYGLVAVTMIAGTDVVSALKAKVKNRGDSITVLSTIKVYGKTLGEEDLVSNSFSFPIEVCYGCLVDFPAADDNPADPGIDCANTTGSATTSIPCIFGQDQPATCDTCFATNPVCRAPYCPAGCGSASCPTSTTCDPTGCLSGYTYNATSQGCDKN